MTRHFIWLEHFLPFCLPQWSSSVKDTTVTISPFSSVSHIKLAGWVALVILKMDFWAMFTLMQLKRTLKVAWKHLATCLPESVTTPIGGQCAKTEKGNCLRVNVSMSLFTDTSETLILPSKTLDFWALHFHLQTKRKWTARKSCFK